MKKTLKGKLKAKVDATDVKRIVIERSNGDMTFKSDFEVGETIALLAIFQYKVFSEQLVDNAAGK